MTSPPPGSARPKSPLAGRAYWLTESATAANVGLGGVLFYYCARTIQLPPGSAWSVLWVMLACTVVLLPSSLLIYFRALRTVQGLGTGRLEPTLEHLTRAARELHRFPDRQFWVVFAMWTGGTSSTAPAFQFLIGMAPEHTWQLIFNSLMLAPIGALLTYLMCVLRTRKLLGVLSELGLGADGLKRAIPPRRRSMRRRLMLFSAVLVICPAVVSADLAVSLLTDGMRAIQDAETPALRATAAEAAVDGAVTAVATLGAMLLAFALLIAWAAGNALGRPLQALARDARRLAAADTSRLELVLAEDELWAVCCAFQDLQLQTSEVLGQLQSAGARISSATQSLVGVARFSEDGANTQAHALGATSATTEELAQAAQLIAGSAGDVAGAAQKTLLAAKAGQQSSRAFLESTERLRRDNSEISTAVGVLRERVQRISQIVGFINGVADRADLLALNAELEGTKAGEIGRGFSLVAGEMRRMAEQVVRTTREIEALISDVHGAAKAAADATTEGQGGTASGAELALQLSQMLDRIHGIAQETSDAAQSISLATGKQRAGASELAQAMNGVLQVTEVNVATTRDITQATQGLDELSRALAQAIGQLQASEQVSG